VAQAGAHELTTTVLSDDQVVRDLVEKILMRWRGRGRPEGGPPTQRVVGYFPLREKA
jgi:hypothetical protein